MKILHICPTFSTPTCGIGKYTNHLVRALKESQPVTQYILEGFQSAIHALALYEPDVCHIQLEYSFCSPERLMLIEEYCKQQGTKLVITFHTLAAVAHNVAVGPTTVKLAHTKLAKNYGIFTVIPSGIPIVEPCSDEQLAAKVPQHTLKFIKEKAPMMFFGQAHPHKQLLETIKAFVEHDRPLLCVVSKPVQGNTFYYDSCRELAVKHSSVFWIDQYLEDAEVLKLSEYCTGAVLLYSEYGSIGVSAAVKLLLLNNRLSIFTSPTSHFSDLEYPVVIKTSLDKLFGPQSVHSLQARRRFVQDSSFSRVAEIHYELYGG